MYIFTDEFGEITHGSRTDVSDIEVANNFFSEYPSFCYSVIDGVITLKVDADAIWAEYKAVQEAERLAADRKASVPQVISMRQARLALLGANLLSTVDTAIANSTDEAMKIEWEYSQEVRRDWESLIAMATTLGMSELDLDNLFIAGKDL